MDAGSLGKARMLQVRSPVLGSVEMLPGEPSCKERSVDLTALGKETTRRTSSTELPSPVPVRAAEAAETADEAAFVTLAMELKEVDERALLPAMLLLPAPEEKAPATGLVTRAKAALPVPSVRHVTEGLHTSGMDAGFLSLRR